MFFGGPTNIQNIPQKWPNKNCAKRPPNFRDHLLRDPSAAFYAAPSHQNMSEVLFKTSPERANQELRKMAFQGFQPCFIFLPYEIKSAA